MDWWILKQLRAMVLTDLQPFIPNDYFKSEKDRFKLSENIKNAEHFSREITWGYLAGTLGRKLFFDSPEGMSARQVSASELLMNLGLLASAEGMHGASKQLSLGAQIANISDGNAGAVANQLEIDHIPTFIANIRGALKQYLLHLTNIEKAPFTSLLLSMKSDSEITQAFNQIESIEKNTPIENTTQMNSTLIDIEKHYFDVALSFPGEDRQIVKLIADQLKNLLGEHSYFYDFNYQAQLARPSLGTLLQDLYRNRAKLIVIFLSENYQKKNWCNIEFRAINEIIFERQHQQIMYIRTGDGMVEGVFKTDGYIDANNFTAEEIAKFIQDRVKLLN